MVDLPDGYDDILARLEARNPTKSKSQIRSLARAEMAKRVEEIRTQWASRDTMLRSELAHLKAEARRFGVRLKLGDGLVSTSESEPCDS